MKNEGRGQNTRLALRTLGRFGPKQARKTSILAIINTDANCDLKYRPVVAENKNSTYKDGFFDIPFDILDSFSLFPKKQKGRT